MSNNAPVAVFAYSRPNHLRRTLQTLCACEGFGETPVTVFIDGPKSPETKGKVDEVQAVARNMLGDSADIRVSAVNKGLSRSITSGVADLLEAHGRVIVVEDDLDLSPIFLRYMNAALDRYADTQSVYQISGFMFDVPEFKAQETAVVLPFTTTWGWATWSSAWKVYDPKAKGWKTLQSDRNLRKRFNLGGNYPYDWLMQRQMKGQSDSWGIRWYWSVFREDGLTVFPPNSLVSNSGQDGSGSHGGGVLADFSGTNQKLLSVAPKFPDNVRVDSDKLAAVQSAIWRQNGGWFGWGLTKLRKVLGR